MCEGRSLLPFGNTSDLHYLRSPEPEAGGCESKTSLGYIVRHYLIKQTKKGVVSFFLGSESSHTV